jgi:hypothetical protein
MLTAGKHPRAQRVPAGNTRPPWQMSAARTGFAGGCFDQLSMTNGAGRLATTSLTHICSQPWQDGSAPDHPAAIHFTHDTTIQKRAEGGTAKETVPR